ncbi:hypothetical protein DUI87_26961 [Hirundo rustica rustica]|uniref:Cadherin domain-containing protein n=1 Tax=Hirundo rustica rustica TaxID=333673 RepID=A0A3M0J7S2_HIRRU|nr:hypothetical protein DUI87_26961 [Hirundo rustica rustica]
MELLISVLDANDNAPQFNQSVYKVQLPENATEGTLVMRVNATDPDEGITARDQGWAPLSGHCKVVLEVLDVNDNAPEVWVTSLSVPVSEDASVGTVVAVLSVSDRDSGANGRVRCWVWPASPFGLEATFAGSYSLVLREALDRERVSEYELEVRAEDGGAPALRASRGLRVPVSDVNDNAPAFAQAVYTVLARENNAAGAELARLWARDPDEAGNGRVSYSVWEGGVAGGGAALPPSSSSSGPGWRPASSYVSVDAESGLLWALQPLDYEELQVLQFEVRAVDAGEPPLCGNATVQLFVLDENDNAPALLPPAGSAPEAGPVPAEAAAAAGSGTLWAWAAWGAPAGQVVAKIRAVDADSGYNAWLRYELWEPRAKGPFRVGLYSGEVSTARALDEADGPRHTLLIVVRDHGQPARSATATLSVSLLEAGRGGAGRGRGILLVGGFGLVVVAGGGGRGAGARCGQRGHQRVAGGGHLRRVQPLPAGPGALRGVALGAAGGRALGARAHHAGVRQRSGQLVLLAAPQPQPVRGGRRGQERPHGFQPQLPSAAARPRRQGHAAGALRSPPHALRVENESGRIVFIEVNEECGVIMAFFLRHSWRIIVLDSEGFDFAKDRLPWVT